MVRSFLHQCCHRLLAEGIGLQSVVCKPSFHLNYRVRIIQLRQFLHRRSQAVTGYTIDLDALLKDVTLERMRKIFEDVMKRRDESVDQVRSRFGVIKREKISLEGRIRDVLKYVRGHHRVSFRHMVAEKKDKMEVVVSFLAILELMKMGRITAVQEQPFGDLDIAEVERPEGSDDELDMKGLEDFD